MIKFATILTVSLLVLAINSQAILDIFYEGRVNTGKKPNQNNPIGLRASFEEVTPFFRDSAYMGRMLSVQSSGNYLSLLAPYFYTPDNWRYKC